MFFWNVRDPYYAELLGPFIDIEVLGFVTFIYYFWHYRPRRCQHVIPQESQSEGAIMQTRAGYSCTESHLDKCQCKKDTYTI